MSSPTEITYPFTFSPEVDNFTKSPQHLLARNPDLAGLAVGAFVFNRHGKVLLIKRSKADSYPDLWEVPGGGIDSTDPTILHGLSRELQEETGITLTHIRRCFEQVILISSLSGRKYRKYNFIAEIEDGGDDYPVVKIDTNEHSEYRWCGWHELGKWNNPDDITADKLAFTTEDMRKSVVLALELVEKEKREQLAKGRNGDMIPDAES